MADKDNNAGMKELYDAAETLRKTFPEVGLDEINRAVCGGSSSRASVETHFSILKGFSLEIRKEEVMACDPRWTPDVKKAADTVIGADKTDVTGLAKFLSDLDPKVLAGIPTNEISNVLFKNEIQNSDFGKMGADDVMNALGEPKNIAPPSVPKP
ncbi:MAG TPA: hypothetical protein DEA55_09505 [Rhodospirillaceae bacterium]|nr:hypothetical protein [Rhodospirillaceae bacterium]